MSSSPPFTSLIRLLLIDEDSVFRLGVRVLLEQYPDLTLVAEAEDGETALQILAHQFARPLDSGPDVDAPPSANLLVLDIGLGRSNPEQIQGLDLCRTLKSRYPTLPILCLGNASEPIIWAAARQAGVDGYCFKQAEPTELITAMRRVAGGQAVWPSQALDLTQPRPTSLQSPARRSRAPLARFRRNLRLSGIQQIEAALVDVNAELRNLDLSLLDRAVLAGRQRELRAARWLVNQLLATPQLEAIPSQSERSQSEQSQSRATSSPRASRATAPVSPAPSSLISPSPAPANAIVPVPEAAIVDTQSIQSLVFDAVLAKLQTGLANQTEMPLEIDILREDKKRDLFYLILRKLEEVLSELRYSQVEPQQLPSKRLTILLDLWQTALLDFFGRYYTVRLNGIEVEVVDVLLQDAAVVEVAILDKIPGVIELLQHLLFQAPLAVDSVPYPVGNPESLARAELLLDNLLIQIANAVMQPLLNRFANVEAIKQNFYDRRLLSIREIERFRNNLSWKYRFNRVFQEPKNIFESQYQLLTFTGRGIKQTSIYASRTEELAALTGLPYVVTLALETRDAIAPRLRATVSFVGNGLVYVLTEVIGRGIGLIGRGVLKGLGNVWQDPGRRDRTSR
jgi:DNA-binding NarL/FixJ family response regulator